MQQAAAEMSSVSTQLEDLTRRVIEAASRFDEGGREDVAHELYEVERSLRSALRRLNRATRDVGR